MLNVNEPNKGNAGYIASSSLSLCALITCVVSIDHSCSLMKALNFGHKKPDILTHARTAQ